MASNPSRPVGLCAVCRHVKIVKSARGSVFVMCRLSRQDKRFNKYPVLPVVACLGFEPATKRQSPAE